MDRPGNVGHAVIDTVEPLIKDTLNKGHLCIKDTFRYTNLFTSERGQALYIIFIMDKMMRPNVSGIQRFHYTLTTHCCVTQLDLVYIYRVLYGARYLHGRGRRDVYSQRGVIWTSHDYLTV